MRFRRKDFLFAGLCICLIGVTTLSAQQTRRVNLASGESRELKIIRPTGVAQIDTQVPSIRVSHTELLFERIESPPIKFPPESLPEIPDRIGSWLGLPFLFKGIKANGTVMDLATVVDMHPHNGLAFSPKDSRFECTLYVGVCWEDNLADRDPLPSPIDFLITASAGITCETSTIRLVHLNQPFESVKIWAEAPIEPASVRIRPSFSDVPKSIELGVIRPELTAAVSPRSIWGWGLEDADITIGIKNIALTHNIPVTLTTTKGRIDMPRVEVNNEGTARSKIRSSGTGSATIRAFSFQFSSEDLELRFAFPWVFLLMAILGGLIGTAARKKIKFTQKNIISGLTLGLLGAFLYAIDVNLTGVIPDALRGEAVIFAVAGVVSYFGQLILPTTK